MARKRGGLAGIWDRNKGVIQKVAPAALSFIPGVGIPLAAAAGAAMRGLDRPGKSGIGLDVGQAIRGGIEGYGIGKGTQAIAGGVKGLLTAGRGATQTAAPSAAAAGTPPQVGMPYGVGAPLESGSAMFDPTQPPMPTWMQERMGTAVTSGPTAGPLGVGGGIPATPPPSSTMQPYSNAGKVAQTARRGASAAAKEAARAAKIPEIAADRTFATGTAQSAFQRAFPTMEQTIMGGDQFAAIPEEALTTGRSFLGSLRGFTRDNKDLLTAAGRGIQSALPQRESRAEMMAAETGRMNAETQRRFSEFQMQQTQEQQQREEERRRAILQFLSPYIRQNAPMLNPGAFGNLG